MSESGVRSSTGNHEGLKVIFHPKISCLSIRRFLWMLKQLQGLCFTNNRGSEHLKFSAVGNEGRGPKQSANRGHCFLAGSVNRVKPEHLGDKFLWWWTHVHIQLISNILRSEPMLV